MNVEPTIRTIAAIALGALLAGAASAQDAATPTFGEVVEVQLVNVEIWVTDGQGNPIKGLSAADFEVLEDGKPVAITHFAEIDNDRQVLHSIDRVLARSEPEAAPSEAPPADPNHLVIYFDQLHLQPAGRNQLIEDLRSFLATEQVPAERVLILNQDYGLFTEVTFGSSFLELDAALDRIAHTAPAGGRVEMEKRLALQRLQDLWRFCQDIGGSGPTVSSSVPTCDCFVPRAAPEVELFASESRERISVTLDHLAAAASFLTGLPGVKTLLYLSDSLERSPGSDLLPFVSGLCPEQDKTPPFIVSDELGRAFRRLTRHANANRVTIYAIQPGGLQGSFIGSAQQRSLEQQGTRGLDTNIRLAERDGMNNLAAETGGRAIFNRNEFGPELTKVALEMASYYSLAYVPPHAGDEAEHQIAVRMRDRSLQVRHRQGYRDKSPDVRMTERLQGAVYLGLVDNPLGVRLGAGTVRRAEDGFTVPLHILVPAENVTFLPIGESLMAQLAVQVSTRNTESQKGIFEQSVFRVRRSPTDDSETVGVVMELTLPAGVHLVAVGLRDDSTRESSFVTTTLELSASAGGPTG